MGYKLKGKKNIKLNEAIRFHGHLGPYLVLGILAGELALKKLKVKKYFGLNVKVWGAADKPKSCLVDGLQLSTGATYGKGNISKFNGRLIKIQFCVMPKKRNLVLRLKDDISAKLTHAGSHRKCEILAKGLFNADASRLFDLKLNP